MKIFLPGLCTVAAVRIPTCTKLQFNDACRLFIFVKKFLLTVVAWGYNVCIIKAVMLYIASGCESALSDNSNKGMVTVYLERTQVLSNEQVAPSCFRVKIACGEHFSASLPGQFVMIGLNQQGLPLLKRPFSIHRLRYRSGKIYGIEILYKVIGRFTRALSQSQKNDRIDLLGPLGHGFDVEPEVKRFYIAAGGIGVAPFLFLLQNIESKGGCLNKAVVFLGGRTRNDLLCQEEFSNLGIIVHTSTDDGSAGEKGLLTGPLRNAVLKEAPDMIYACGPQGMLSCVADIARTYSAPCQVSIETIMACGMGACLGCAIGQRHGARSYLHACMDGPVFNADDLDL